MLTSLIASLVLMGALSLLARRAWLHHCPPQAEGRRQSLLHLAGLWLRLAPMLLVSAAASPWLSAMVGLAWAAYETLDLMAWKYLNLPIRKVVLHAPVKLTDADAIPNLVNTLRTFVPWRTFAILAVAAMVGVALYAAFAVAPPLMAIGLAAMLIAGALGLRFMAGRITVGLSARPAESAFLTVDGSLPEGRLVAADRRAASIVRSDKPSAAKHVLLVLNESAGDDVKCHGQIDLVDAICAASGDASGWLRATRSVTPSSCTDIALPCLFTGCAPEESTAKLHSLPMLFDLAKARGMTTMFYSASTLRWANFEAFFGVGSPTGAIDELATPHTTGLPFVHELGCDDYLMAKRLHDRILEAEGPLFIVLYTYGLHLPFQSDSAGPIPEHITDRRCRAAYTVTQAHRMAFDALRQTGRYDETLIISIGDHGEAFGVDGSDRSSGSSRLTKLSATVTQPLFVIKPPAGMEAAHRACLAANMSQLVSLIDIAPTLASMLAVDLAGDSLSYKGHDLTRQAVPDDRVHYTLTVNEWRKWPQAATMIAQGDMRLCIDYQTVHALCSDGAGQPLSPALYNHADTLLARAQAVPVVSQVIARVFRDKLDNRALLTAERFTVTVPDLPRPQPVQGGHDTFFGHDILVSDAVQGRLHFVGRCHDENGFGLHQEDRGILLYGPYVALPAGRYAASFVFAPGSSMRPLTLDVCAADQPCIAHGEITQLKNGQTATITFDLPCPAQGLEVRLHSHHGFSGLCLGLFLTQTGVIV
jgi:Sulfatase